MKLIIPCSNSDEFSDDRAEYALVDLSPSTASLMLRRIATFNAVKHNEPGLIEMYISEEIPECYFDPYAGGLEESETSIRWSSRSRRSTERCTLPGWLSLSRLLSLENRFHLHRQPCFLSISRRLKCRRSGLTIMDKACCFEKGSSNAKRNRR